MNPKPIEKDRVKPLDADLVEIRFSAPKELDEKLQRLKGLLAHSDPHITLAEIVDKLADLDYFARAAINGQRFKALDLRKWSHT